MYIDKSIFTFRVFTNVGRKVNRFYSTIGSIQNAVWARFQRIHQLNNEHETVPNLHIISWNLRSVKRINPNSQVFNRVNDVNSKIREIVVF